MYIHIPQLDNKQRELIVAALDLLRIEYKLMENPVTKTIESGFNSDNTNKMSMVKEATKSFQGLNRDIYKQRKAFAKVVGYSSFRNLVKHKGVEQANQLFIEAVQDPERSKKIINYLNEMD